MTEGISEGRTLIVTIVKRSWGDTVTEASIKAGAEGGTMVFGRGRGIHEQKKIMGLAIEPEKEIIFTVTQASKAGAILNEIVKAARLDEPGNGIAFTIPVGQFVGAVHAAADQPAEEPPPDPAAE